MKKFQKIVFSAFLFVSFAAFAQEEGAAYYPALKSPKDIIVMKTSFDVYFDVLFNTLAGNENLKPACRLEIPSNWNKAYSDFKGTKTAFGCASYRLVLKGLKSNCQYAFARIQDVSDLLRAPPAIHRWRRDPRLGWGG